MIVWSRTKIIATLGPASGAPTVMESMAMAGADIFRLNFSHGSPARHARSIALVRKLERRLSTPLGILQDLPGPKIRLGALPPDGLPLSQGQEIAVTAPGVEPKGIPSLPLPRASLVASIKTGHTVYIADGLVRLQVLRVKPGMALCRVAAGGRVGRGNGVNLPDTPLALSAFTKADAAFLRFGIAQGVDFAGLSFVGSADDVFRARAFAQRQGRAPFIIAKIERRQALRKLKEIIRAADGLMVARGDLGVEMPFAELPGLQEDIVRQARREGKPVIVATQVLESMVGHPRPTRAEAMDVAHAVWSGADAVMLSGETAAGKYPVESVRALSAVIRATERRPVPLREEVLKSQDPRSFAREAARLAESAEASCLVLPTRSGRTAALLSSVRTKLPVVAVVNDRVVERRLALFWGLKTLFVSRPCDTLARQDLVLKDLLSKRFLRPGRRAALLRSTRPGAPGPDLLQILNVK